MKKVLSMLLVLPLMAATFIACSSDDDITTAESEQPAKKTVTFIASFDPQTRVAYTDKNNNLKNRWDANDNGGTVTFKSSANSEEYTFTIGNITDGLTATLTYTNDNGDFPSDFEGTATYEVAPIDQQQAVNNQLQVANGSLTANVPDAISHLHNGTKLVADVSKGKTSIQFRHVGTSFFRVAITVPEGGITRGSELVVRADGKEIGKVEFNFDLAYDPNPDPVPLVAYLRATTQEKATRLSYTIIQGEDTYSYKSEFSSLNLVEGRYYYTDLRGKTKYEMPKSVFDQLGNASVDVKAVDLGIYLNDDEELVSEAVATKKLLIGDRFLGASRSGDDDVLYFYFGETKGHRVNLSTGELKLNDGDDPDDFTYADVASQRGKKGYATYLRQELSALTSGDKKILQIDPASRSGYVLTKEYDAAHVQLGGGWRMLSLAEVKALYGKIGASGFNLYKKHDITCCSSYTGKRAKFLQIIKNGTALIELPMCGCIEGGNLISSFRRHLYDGPITCTTASRDVDAKHLQDGKIYQYYAYGAIDGDYGEEELNFGEATEAYPTNWVYLGVPILPCMVVKIGNSD